MCCGAIKNKFPFEMSAAITCKVWIPGFVQVVLLPRWLDANLVAKVNKYGWFCVLLMQWSVYEKWMIGVGGNKGKGKNDSV